MGDNLPPEFSKDGPPRDVPAAVPATVSFGDFVQQLTESGIHPELLSLDARGSLAPRPPNSEAPKLSVASLPSREITLKTTIGRGGMGEVLVGDQASLAREVAVKRSRSETDPALADHRLILEARVSGHVEHPNVVPVHLLGSDDGKPLLVMKRIEGESWQALLARGVDLSRDIPILMDVCHALHYAHSRGVVHRDVKPGNVMVGAFGEVYLLDWGLAAGFSDSAPDDLRATVGEATIVGTPAYLAPEMVVPDAEPDPRSDVFLAGAVLHEVVTGRPPHAADSLVKTLFAARSAVPPVFDEGVPEELRAICRRAMAPDLDDRYQSAEDFRQALAGFMDHSAARGISAEAEARLETMLAAGPDASDGEMQSLFAECRFGFQHALSVWPESERARRGLDRALAAMAWRQIKAGRPDPAALFLADLGDRAPADLVAALDELQQRHDRKQQRTLELLRIAREGDLRTALGERTTMVLGGLVLWLFGTGLLAVLTHTERFIAGPGTFSAALGVLSAAFLAAYAFVPQIRKTKASRATSRTLVATLMALSATHGVAFELGLPAGPGLAMGQIPFALGLAAVCNQHDRPWGVSLVPVIVIVPMLMWPAHATWMSGVGSFVCVVWLVGQLRVGILASQLDLD